MAKVSIFKGATLRIGDYEGVTIKVGLELEEGEPLPEKLFATVERFVNRAINAEIEPILPIRKDTKGRCPPPLVFGDE